MNVMLCVWYNVLRHVLLEFDLDSRIVLINWRAYKLRLCVWSNV